MTPTAQPAGNADVMRAASAQAIETCADLAWEDWLCAVEGAVNRTIDSTLIFEGDGIDAAYIAFSNGRTASDYALEVVARAGESA